MKEKSKLKKISMIILIIILIILSSSIVYGVKENTAAYVWYCKNEIPVKTTKVALDELYVRANQIGNASNIANDRLNIGKTVKGYKPYTKAAGGTSDEWQIMYADANHVYIITKYKVYNTTGNDSSLSPAGDTENGSLRDYYADGNKLFKNYRAVNAGWLDKYMTSSYKAELNGNTWVDTSVNTNSNMRSVAYMLDSGQWNRVYRVAGKADWVIGGPTIEMLCKSYDKVQENTAKYDALSVPNANGYNGYASNVFGTSNTLTTSITNPVTGSGTIDTWWNNSESYWLASPGSGLSGDVLFVHYHNSYVNIYNYGHPNFGFRPVVCLSSRAVLDWDSTNSVYWVK